MQTITFRKNNPIQMIDGLFKQWRLRFSSQHCVIQLLLLPSIFGIWHFGWAVAAVLVTSVVSCFVTGYLIRVLDGKPRRWDHAGSVLTGLLIGLTCGAETPLYMMVVGGVVAEFLGKVVLRGPKGNIINPAVLGRMAIALLETIDPIEYADLSTGASALFKEEGGLIPPAYFDAFLGLTKGSIGETSAIILLFVGFVMLRYVVLKWHASIAVLITIPVVVAVLPVTPEIVGHAPWVVDPLLFIIGGPTLVLSFFFVTDPATSPNTKAGAIIFGMGVGLFAVLGKLYTSIPGVEMYGILFMNLLTPLLNRLTFIERLT